jgi:glycerophosphoryl diester phosphodiesterase
MSHPLIIGHRGASAFAPENTVPAFRKALSAGADGLEFDVRLSRDGVPMVIHDADLKRTGQYPLLVSESTSEQLSNIDVGTWFNLKRPSFASPDFEKARVPTLSEALGLNEVVKPYLFVELKCDENRREELCSAVVEKIREFEVLERVIVESFDLPAIGIVKALEPSLKTAALFEPTLTRPLISTEKMISQAEAVHADYLALHHSLATERRVDAAKIRGLATVVWTVDKPIWVDRARRYGIEALITNDPAALLQRRAMLDSE